LKIASPNLVVLTLCVLSICWTSPVISQDQFDSEPIRYSDADTDNPVAQLQQELESGKTLLQYDESNGYLPDLLRQLEIPESSQMLVFSQTSFQLRKISPDRPRAIYFNDDTYIGWVQGGDVIEVSTTDPQKGAIFYSLKQGQVDQPRFVRDQGNCLACHASSRTQGVPGHVVRSVWADKGGSPLYGAGTFTTSQESLFQQRWGGWYVTGTHGSMKHMGNLTAKDRDTAEFEEPESGWNRTSLDDLVNTRPYLKPTSDIVALMVLEHQTQMHNFITLANFETRSAQHYDQLMNKTLGRDPDFQSESAVRRMESAAEKLVRYLLFDDEFPLTDPVKGVSNFTTEFAARGPFDSQQRSLRAFDLQRRLFKYPCSYLIYSKSFAALPAELKQIIFRKLYDVLAAESSDDEYDHLSLGDRQAIWEILSETHPECAEAFQLIRSENAR
jgi:hypothetical protein